MTTNTPDPRDYNGMSIGELVCEYAIETARQLVRDETLPAQARARHRQNLNIFLAARSAQSAVEQDAA